jgi:hypothetical protein
MAVRESRSGSAVAELGHRAHAARRMWLARLLALLAIALLYVAWPNLRPDFTLSTPMTARAISR